MKRKAVSFWPEPEPGLGLGPAPAIIVVHEAHMPLLLHRSELSVLH